MGPRQSSLIKKCRKSRYTVTLKKGLTFSPGHRKNPFTDLIGFFSTMAYKVILVYQDLLFLKLCYAFFIEMVWYFLFRKVVIRKGFKSDFKHNLLIIIEQPNIGQVTGRAVMYFTHCPRTGKDAYCNYALYCVRTRCWRVVFWSINVALAKICTWV